MTSRILCFFLDPGTITLGCPASWAFRIRVSISAILSVFTVTPLLGVILSQTLILSPTLTFSPTGLGYAWNFSAQRSLSQTQAAELKFSIKPAWAATTQTAIIAPGFKFWFALGLGD